MHNKNIMNKNILILSIAIILAGIIFGGFYYASEVNKQQSIEKQQQTELQAKIQKDQQAKQIEEDKKTSLDLCLSDAKVKYNNQMNHYWNSWTNRYTVVVPSAPVGVALAENLKNEEDTCLKQYK
jgi:hypothetical protein